MNLTSTMSSGLKLTPIWALRQSLQAPWHSCCQARYRGHEPCQQYKVAVGPLEWASSVGILVIEEEWTSHLAKNSRTFKLKGVWPHTFNFLKVWRHHEYNIIQTIGIMASGTEDQTSTCIVRSTPEYIIIYYIESWNQSKLSRHRPVASTLGAPRVRRHC